MRRPQRLTGAALRRLPGLRPDRSPRRARESASRPTSQGGYSLLEVLITVVLVGTVIIAIAAGMLALIRATKATSDNQRAQSALLSFTESLKASPYLPCGGSPTPSAAAYEQSHAEQSASWDPDNHQRVEVSIDEIGFWHGDGDYGTYEPSCPADDQGRQMLQVSVRLHDGPTASGTVVVTDRPDPPPEDEEGGP